MPILLDLIKLATDSHSPSQYTYIQAQALAATTTAASDPLIIFVSTAGGTIFTSVGFWGWDKTNWIQF
jgi:hypothetical protein